MIVIPLRWSDEAERRSEFDDGGAERFVKGDRASYDLDRVRLNLCLEQPRRYD